MIGSLTGAVTYVRFVAGKSVYKKKYFYSHSI